MDVNKHIHTHHLTTRTPKDITEERMGGLKTSGGVHPQASPRQTGLVIDSSAARRLSRWTARHGVVVVV